MPLLPSCNDSSALPVSPINRSSVPLAPDTLSTDPAAATTLPEMRMVPPSRTAPRCRPYAAGTSRSEPDTSTSASDPNNTVVYAAGGSATSVGSFPAPLMRMVPPLLRSSPCSSTVLPATVIDPSGPASIMLPAASKVSPRTISTRVKSLTTPSEENANETGVRRPGGLTSGVSVIAPPPLATVASRLDTVGASSVPGAISMPGSVAPLALSTEPMPLRLNVANPP